MAAAAAAAVDRSEGRMARAAVAPSARGLSSAAAATTAAVTRTGGQITSSRNSRNSSSSSSISNERGHVSRAEPKGGVKRRGPTMLEAVLRIASWCPRALIFDAGLCLVLRVQSQGLWQAAAATTTVAAALARVGNNSSNNNSSSNGSSVVACGPMPVAAALMHSAVAPTRTTAAAAMQTVRRTAMYETECSGGSSRSESGCRARRSNEGRWLAPPLEMRTQFALRAELLLPPLLLVNNNNSSSSSGSNSSGKGKRGCSVGSSQRVACHSPTAQAAVSSHPNSGSSKRGTCLGSHSLLLHSNAAFRLVRPGVIHGLRSEAHPWRRHLHRRCHRRRLQHRRVGEEAGLHRVTGRLGE